MKNSSKLLILSLLFCSRSFSQSIPSTITYNKSEETALKLDIPYTQEITEGFIVQKLKRTGHDPESKGQLFWKQNKLNGFYVFKKVQLDGLQKPVDLYFKIDQKSNRLKDQSVIYMLVSEDEHFISAGSNERAFGTTKKLLDNFLTESVAYKMERDIMAQEQEVKAAEGMLKKLKTEEKDLIVKLAQLQEEINKNKSSQNNQQMAIESERKKLADLKTRGLNL